MLRRAVAKDDEFGASGVDAGKVVAELRNLLLAEQSAKVANHGEDDGLFLPLFAKASG